MLLPCFSVPHFGMSIQRHSGSLPHQPDFCGIEELDTRGSGSTLHYGREASSIVNG